MSSAVILRTVSSMGVSSFSLRHPEVRAALAASLEGRRPLCGSLARAYHTRMGAHVYMLRCADGSFYVGSATGEELTPRITQHQIGTFEGYTSLRRPVERLGSEYFDRITDAIAVERQIKGWSRKKKLSLIEGDWAALRQHSKRRGGTPKPSSVTLRRSAAG